MIVFLQSLIYIEMLYRFKLKTFKNLQIHLYNYMLINIHTCKTLFVLIS